MSDLRATLETDLAEAERKAWDSLARYKFFMFGYHAADWVKINRRLGGERWNPFKDLVDAARAKRTEQALGPVKALPPAHAERGSA